MDGPFEACMEDLIEAESAIQRVRELMDSIRNDEITTHYGKYWVLENFTKALDGEQ